MTRTGFFKANPPSNTFKMQKIVIQVNKWAKLRTCITFNIVEKISCYNEVAGALVIKTIFFCTLLILAVVFLFAAPAQLGKQGSRRNVVISQKYQTMIPQITHLVNNLIAVVVF